MTSQTVQALGPLFGPDFITVQVNDETGKPYSLEVFPDANNPALKNNGLPTQFYYLPKQVNLARKVDAPDEYDFSMTLFKGLATEEDQLMAQPTPTVGGESDAGGAFLAFSTTMAVPDSVIKGALAQLKAKSHPAPPARIAMFFLRDGNDPEPLLGIVPICDNNVTIEIPQLPGADNKSPMFLSAQGTGHGSIEVSGISSFLVTCNQGAAGAIVGALKEGRSPFTVHYNLKMMFYINDCDISMDVDVDKTFTQFSGAMQAKYGFFAADLQANYQSCVTSGAITTVIQMNGTDVDPDIKQLIDKQVADMQDKAWNLVKTEIFDWQPKPDDPAKASAGACGGVAVSLKFGYQKHAVHFNDHFILNQTITKLDTVSGTLTSLESEIKKHLDTYLSIVDIGEYFKKIQVCASPNIDFDNDPIQEALLVVSYPDFDKPKGPDGQPSLTTRVEGFHYNATKIDQAAPVTLTRWTRDNPTDIVNVAFLKIDNDMPNWKRDQVKLKTKLVYKPDDSRVDLSNNGITMESEFITNDHAPVVGPESVGYIFIRFILDRPIKTPNVTVTLTVQIGNRSDVIELTNSDPTKNPFAELQIWSDKYFNETVAKVKIDVEVAPPPSDFAGSAVTWSGVQAVPLNLGRIKRIVPCKITVPELKDAEKAAQVGQYILETIKEMSGAVHA
ncbi:MAG: hypothetical protein ACJ75B_15420 [Flavisolibacter sp.]